MRIAVDATSWFNERGYGRYTRELLRAMAASSDGHELVCLVDARDVERFDLAGAVVHGVAMAERPTDAATADGNRSPADMRCMTAAVRAVAPDVVFYPTVYSYFPRPRGVRSVVGVHDTIAERFPRLTLPSWRARLFWRLKVRLALWQARLVLTVSDFAARDIERVLGVPARRLRATGEAPAPVFRPGASDTEIVAAARVVGLPEGARWFCYVGGFNPHKNVEALVRAHGALCRELEGPPRLVLVGTLSRDVFHGGLESIQAAVRSAGTEQLVHWPGFVEDDALRALHAGSLGLVLPSLCEGFGLPAAEAAACGAPLIATNESPLPELFAGGGVFFDPRDEAALLAALRAFATDEPRRAAFAKRALECAEQLDWSAAARVAWRTLEEAAR